ncbi:vacuolar protein sorting/targeting protein 10 [Lindgomyces ingoldianus]|uniref:Vacuolar protein sorting/targeting protein 10 n=1 Tax=Lindgomyces ingoldianus TaxID=673940 RepID=A0ACB6QL24_9PLEO|nr:vacuolar protein sorting/targeting protein 10 [Lindgomyces ingoldianus]KAF2467591.1 vacuolar protein sorting/targeting protein 10 [Lindgomyces ingoldianus]
MRYLKGILLPALLVLASFASAKKDAPLIETTPFDRELISLLYFDDSEVILSFEFDTGRIWRSKDSGKKWEQNKDIQTLGILKNPFNNKVAIAVGQTKHYITYDQGESWNEFDTEFPPSMFGSGTPVSWHRDDSKKILFSTLEDCITAPCLGRTFYTEDGFKSKPKLLRSDRKMCMWARSSDRFLLESDKHQNRILCITKGKYSDRPKDFRLLMSDNYFKDGDEKEPVMSSGRTVSGMANMASVKGYLVAAAKSDHSRELALYVTDDTEIWHRAEFGEGKIEEDAYTILESTNYSIQVDVVTQRLAYVGSLYTSNSNGTYFTKNIDHTNRSPDGYVDFEKVANIQGIVLVNVVDNADELATGARKKIKSKISFDDGRTFESLKAGDDEIHLHSVTDLSNSGRVFSSPAPGIVMGIGNTGDFLGQYTDGDLYVSDDAGLTWTLALQEAHKYEFGDQGSVLVAVFDEGETDEIQYSLSHGQPKSWKPIKLNFKFRARELTTVPDSTSLKFVLYGTRSKKGGGREYVIVHLDFAELHESECKDSDFEPWEARNGECIMGQKQVFRRRKRDAECFINEEFKDPVPVPEPCECDAVKDFECDFNFTPSGTGNDKECTPSGALTLPKGACEGDAKTYKGPSGWRKIPGNQCKGGKTDKLDDIERDCDEWKKKPQSNKITTKFTSFKGSKFLEYYYLERGTRSQDHDETVVMLTDQREAWITHNHGKEWTKAVKDDVVAIYPHQYNNDRVYFLTGSKKVWYSVDRGMRDSIHSFNAPTMPNTETLQIMQFHPHESDWIIWIGGEHCKKVNDPECHTLASVSRKNGLDWENLMPFVKKCAFVWREEGRAEKQELIFCEQHTKEEMGAPLELLSSDDWFKTKEVKFKSVVEFATMSEFIIVATKGGEDGKSLKVDASLDGSTFADAKFPPKFNVDHQTAYTVLDSSTHSIFLHVTVNPRRDQEYGSIIKSNSNGTSYVLSLNAVNRNTKGYVDFEKMQGIEGVALANVVANQEEVDGGAKKKKKTVITHNDGADWISLKAPEIDSLNNEYSCDVTETKKCSLHLHGYTERGDPRETFSSPTAVGIMMGVGNVGEHLDTIGEASTFITTDAGITWKEAKKGTYVWEFGDQGSVIVLVRRGEDTNHLFYSVDLGEWKRFDFADRRIRVDAITTVPSDTSLNFLIWGKDGKELVTINVDFSDLKEFKEQCKLDEENPTAGDYELWTPQHPILDDQQQCLFGHVAEYHRKKRDSKCFNGMKIDHLHEIKENCSCTRRDFECDFNFERLPGGECKRIEGLELPDAQAVCKNKGVKEYWEITGYRKIPISTCVGGKEMEHTSRNHPCPGYEDEFQKKHGITGFGLSMAIVIPFITAGGIGYYIWRNWDGKFGRIRLGDNVPSLDSESPWVSWPVAAISGLVAVVAAVPLLIGSLWKMVSSRFGGYGGRTYTSRSSFARGRGDYAVVDPDEGELLGEDSDEDV